MPKRQRIYDPVYGYVELDDVEFELVTLPIFQRLHGIKQLGPLHTVFPSAQHSRFSHSIGVFHIVKKMIEHLKQKRDEQKYNYKYKFPGKEKELLKFAALLHDIGHVPLSHVGEEVLKSTAGEQSKAEPESQGKDRTYDVFEPARPSWRNLFPEEKYCGDSTKLHERLSAEIVLHNKDIDKVLMRVDGWKDEKERDRAKQKIAQIIVGKDYTDVPTLLLHSELDADRLDYLLRDSFFTGVGYGQIDLDYIISRLAIFRDDGQVADLCVEHKGLHTVEHYILGRFFLQTQVIFNRKVRFMDLIYRDVMQYMVRHRNEDVRLMSLEELRDCIRSNGPDDLHKIYAYTDAQVFSKMRKLHEELDEKKKQSGTTGEEEYINDCVKTIMDGRIPEPVFPTCQLLIDLAKEKDRQSQIEDQVNRIAGKVAKKLGVYEARVKANVVGQEVMKYRERMGAKEEGEEGVNLEAVRIMYKKLGEGDEIKPAAKSNATILSNLCDKALLIFNVYYVAPKSESEKDVAANTKAIETAFRPFVREEFQSERNEM